MVEKNENTKRFIGIGKLESDDKKTITIFLHNRMLKINFFVKRKLRPVSYYYSKEQFDYCIVQELTSIKWFFGFNRTLLRKLDTHT